jgi:uncharacterized protein
MTKEIWLNLPVKDVAKSKEFFSKLGFSFSSGPGDTADSACLLIGEKNVVVMLFAEHLFKQFAGNEVSDSKQASEILISFDAQSSEEVDEITKKAADAGGTVFAEPSEVQGWMYGSGFSDLDGHRWNILFMDKSKMPKAE